jgi:hypothetical protein
MQHGPLVDQGNEIAQWQMYERKNNDRKPALVIKSSNQEGKEKREMVEANRKRRNATTAERGNDGRSSRS